MRLKILSGAPLRGDLDFSEEALLPYEISQSGSYRVVEPEKHWSSSKRTQEEVAIKWRHLEPRTSRLRTGWSQPYIPEGGVYTQTPNFTYSFLRNADGSLDSVKQVPPWQDTTDMTFGEEPSEVDMFDEHSLFLHENLQSSQIAADMDSTVDAADNTIASSSFLTSFESGSPDASESAAPASDAFILHLPPKLALTTLKDIPTAKFLRAIHPQTPTPNFLCVVTADVDRREVHIRKTGATMSLWEITVADDTTSGFKVSFWFRPGSRKIDQAQETQRRTLEALRPSDVVLLRNIALHTFRDTVSGQALSATINRAKTTIDVLSRADGSFSYKYILPLALDEHFGRVKKWAKTHVVSGLGGPRKRKAGGESMGSVPRRVLRSSARHHDASMPPDTMESV